MNRNAPLAKWTTRLLGLKTALALALSLVPQCDSVAAETRIPVDATINGRRVHLAFDTAATESFLFKRTAERLNLKFSLPDAGATVPPGFVAAGMSEHFDFVFQTVTARVQFAVIELPQAVRQLTELDGFFAWHHLRKNVFIFDSSTRSVYTTNVVPSNSESWLRFNLMKNTRLMAFAVPTRNRKHDAVYVDTGAEDGIFLSPVLWDEWIKEHPESPYTLDASYTPAAGLGVSKVFWAREFTIGTLVLKNLPVQVQHAATESLMPNHMATLGLYAFYQLDLVIDGPNEVVYARPHGDLPPPYPHNRLGAVFVPRDMESEPLLAHVAERSPAHLAGIRDNDLLLKIGDLDVTKWRTDTQVMPLSRFWEKPPGTALTLTLKRRAQEFQKTVVLKDILGPSVTTQLTE